MSVEIVAVVPTLGASSLVAALASLRRQGQRLDVTVVHQGVAPVPEAATALADRVVSFPHALGFSAAVNAGLAVRSGQVALLLNDDAELLPGWLAATLPVLAGTPRLAAVQGVNLRPADGTVEGCGIGWNRWWQAVQLAEGREPPAASGDDDARAIFGVSGAAALFRASALGAVSLAAGPFDRDLETYYEDVELAGRLRGAGFRAALVPAARALHHGGGSAPPRGRREELLRGNRLLALARLLGRAAPGQLPRALLRDVLDAARRPTLAVGVLRGWRRARRLLPRFAHGGPPQVPLRELRRLAAEELP